MRRATGPSRAIPIALIVLGTFYTGTRGRQADRTMGFAFHAAVEYPVPHYSRGAWPLPLRSDAQEIK